MTATLQAAAHQDRRAKGANGHADMVTAHDRAAYRDGLDSLPRMIRKAAPEHKETVFKNAIHEAAGYVRRGLSKQTVVECLDPAATAAGLGYNIDLLIDEENARSVEPSTGNTGDFPFSTTEQTL